MQQINLRSSFVPTVLTCPASMHGEGTLIDEDLDVARIGTCGHEIAATMVHDGAPTTPDPLPFLKQHNVEGYADDIDFLCLQAHRLWNGYKEIGGIKDCFPNPQVEIHRSKTVVLKDRDAQITLSGHLDVSTFCTLKGADDGWARVLDWKMGYKCDARRYLDQMKAYSYLQACESPKVKHVTAIIGWLREGVVDVFEFTRKALAEWAKDLFTRAIWWDGQTYSPGWACTYCPRKFDCPGRTQQIQELAVAFGPGGEARGQIMAMAQGNILPADVFHYSVEHAKYLRTATEKFLALAKAVCIEHGPFPIPGEEGKAWGITTRKGRSKINVEAAWDIIAEAIPQDELGSIVEVSKTKLEKALRSQVDKGKGAYATKVMQQLEDAGAITRGKDTAILEIVDVEK